MRKFVTTGLKNTGATFIYAPIVLGGNSVASCISADLLPFCTEAIDLMENNSSLQEINR